jgi:SAM-dependent methyltransferase
MLGCGDQRGLAPPRPAPSAELQPSLRFVSKASPQFAWEKGAPIQALLKALDLKPGQRVLVLGAGLGYFEYPLARAVGAEGLVRLVTPDSLQPEVLNYQAKRSGLPWLQAHYLAPGQWEGPGLEPRTYDLCLWFNSFNLLALDPRFGQTLKGALKPGGRLAVLAPLAAPRFGLDSGWSPALVAGVFQVLGPDFPVLKRLPEGLRTCLEGALSGPDSGVQACLDDGFLVALNRLRQDSSLFFALRRFLPWVQYHSELGQRLSNGDLVHLGWLTYNLFESVDVEDEASPQTSPEIEYLNTLLLASLFAVDNPGAHPEAGAGPLAARPASASYLWHTLCDDQCSRARLAQWFSHTRTESLFSDYDLVVFERLE